MAPRPTNGAGTYRNNGGLVYVVAHALLVNPATSSQTLFHLDQLRPPFTISRRAFQPGSRLPARSAWRDTSCYLFGVRYYSESATRHLPRTANPPVVLFGHLLESEGAGLGCPPFFLYTLPLGSKARLRRAGLLGIFARQRCICEYAHRLMFLYFQGIAPATRRWLKIR